MLTGPDLGAAIEAARKLKNMTKEALAAEFEVKPPSIQNWVRRGTIDKAKLPHLWRYFSDVVGPAHWGLPELSWTDPQPATEGLSVYPVSQVMRHLARETAPRHIDWEQIMKRPLEPEFQTVMPDASMAPDIPRGARVIFITDLVPEPVDFVLVRDRNDGLYVREYLVRQAGSFEAHAKNAAYLPLLSDADGLQVLAVFDGVRGRRAPRP